jgi:predicted transcriptional regulator
MERIRLIAQQRHLSVSEVVRRAIEDYSKREEAICHPYELMKD